MKRYPKYKDSGIEWLGEIPEHWDLKKLKYASRINKNSLSENTDREYEFHYIDIGNVNQDGLISPPEKMIFKDAPSRARRIVKNGDTIISTVRTYLKAIAYIGSDNSNLIASTGFAVLTPNGYLLPRFLYFLISDQRIIDTISSLSVGVGYPAINSSELSSIPIGYPNSIEEQQHIVNYLHQKIEKIGTLIQKKQKQVNLLKEYRTAIINDAVIKGLNPNVKMKDSGIEWLGEIPEHWEIIRVKHLAGNDINVVQTGPFGAQLHASDYVDEGIPLILIRNVNNLQIDDSHIPKISEKKAKSLPMYRLDIGDIVFSRVGSIGRIAIVKEREKGWMISGQMLRIRLNNPQLFNHYAIYVFISSLISEFIKFKSVGSTRESINTEILQNAPLTVPPYIEQQRIVNYIESEATKIDQFIFNINNQLQLLQEYRTSLISEVVTGKIDIRDKVPSCVPNPT